MRLEDRFRVVRVLLEGDGRRTCLAQDKLDDAMCVLKLAPAGSERAVQLREEALRMSSLSHPHLIELRALVHEHEDPGTPGGLVSGLCAELADGAALGHRSLGGALAPTLQAFAQLAGVVRYLHARGLLHLDLKPDNILWDGGRLTLLDLGSALPIDALSGTAGGTPGYAAPEVRAAGAPTPAADLYSFGVLLLEALSGVAPRPDATWGPAAVDGRLPSTASAVAPLLRALLQEDPSQRPDGMGAVIQRLVALGAAPPAALGAPPMVGRAAEVEVLVDRLVRGRGERVAVVGPPGSGRQTTCRRALFEAMERGCRVVWLDGPGRGAVLARLEEALRSGGGARWSGVVLYRGPVAAWADPERFLWERVADALRGAGAQDLFVTARARPETVDVALRLQPLHAGQVGPVAAFYGVALDAARRSLERSGGWPGPFSRALGAAAGEREELSDLAERAARRLSQAPLGVPPDALAALLGPSVAAVDELHARYLAWTDAEGRLWAQSPVGAAGPLPPPAASALAAAAAATSDARWRAHTRLQLGTATPGELREALSAETDPELRGRLLRGLVDAGDGGARDELAQLTMLQSGPAEVLDLLAGWPERTPVQEALAIRALRRLGRLDAALERAQAWAWPDPQHERWIQLGYTHADRRAWGPALEAADQLEALGDSRAVGAAWGLRLRVAWDRLRAGDAAFCPPLLARWEASCRRRSASRVELGIAAKLVHGLGDSERAITLVRRSVAEADQAHDATAAAGTRVNLENRLRAAGRIDEADRVATEALHIAVAAGLHRMQLRLRANRVGAELGAGRLTAARRELRAFADLVERLDDAEGRRWLAYQRAQLALAEGQPEAALALLDADQATGGATKGPPAHDLGLLRGQALLGAGRPREALAVLAEVRFAEGWVEQSQLTAATGLSRIALGREDLREAVALVPESPHASQQNIAGQVLLAAGGEAVDPASMGARRARLDQAARYLRGADAARAASLRDRLLDGPAAALDGIVALTEAVQDPGKLPEAVARLVREALGAHRVLIMVRLPGLGNVTWTELTDAERSGIGEEVLNRIREPGDYWVADDAFADPHLRMTSQTVRTFELKSLLAVAISRGDEAIGALYVDDLHRANRFGPPEIDLLQRLGRSVGGLLDVVSAARAPRGRRSGTRDILGVRTDNIDDISRLERTIEQIRVRGQAGGGLNVLITGPTGAGKTFLADRLAREVLGLRGVIPLGLQELPNEMLVTSLAGSQRGDFTGAEARRGLIQLALRENKALFLDELQDLSRTGQQTLLPLLDLPHRRIGRVTGEQSRIEGDLVVLVGTNAEVERGAWQDVFRKDLWYRLERVQLHLPPLSRRGPEAVFQYLKGFLAAQGGPSPEELFSPWARGRISHAPWPGNLRQLAAFAEQAVLQWRMDPRAIPDDRVVPLLPAAFEGEDVSANRTPEGGMVFVGEDATTLERAWDALDAADYVQKAAAEALGISAPQLNKVLKRNGLLEEVRLRRRARRSRR